MNRKMDIPLDFITLKSESIYNGKVFNVQKDIIQYHQSGNKGIREIVIHPGGAVIVPFTDDKRVILVSQYRYPIKQFSLEFPAGKLEANEDPKNCAFRELKEETGYSSNNIELLGEIYTTPGFCSEKLYLFKAENLISGEHAREEGELEMKTYEFSIPELTEMIISGKIKDSKTIASVFFLLNSNLF